MNKTSPTQRSLALLRKEGYAVQVTEKWNMYARVRVDLFGFIDIVAVKEGETGVIGVQTTSKNNMGARINKITGIREALIWLKSGNRIIVHGWEQKVKPGVRQKWNVTVKEVTLEDFPLRY